MMKNRMISVFGVLIFIIVVVCSLFVASMEAQVEEKIEEKDATLIQTVNNVGDEITEYSEDPDGKYKRFDLRFLFGLIPVAVVIYGISDTIRKYRSRL